MHVNKLGVCLSPFQKATSSNGKEFNFGDLNQDEKDLYTNIVNKLLNYFSERIEHPVLGKTPDSRNYSLIFRQSKSWRNVEAMFNELLLLKTSFKTKKWAENWLKDINLMRNDQKSIKDCIFQLQTCKNELKKLKGVIDNKPLIHKERDIKIMIYQIRKRIIEKLNEKEKQLSSPDWFLEKNPSCQKIIQFLKKNWDCLKLFQEWAEVGLDDEKIFVHPEKNNLTLDEKQEVNKSVKAIFIIGEAGLPKEIPLEYEGEEPGKIIRPTKINIKDFHLASASPGLKRKSSSIQLTDELIFDFPLAEGEYHQVTEDIKTVSETALKLESIVQLAIKEVNQKISGNMDASDENQIKRYLLSFFSLNSLFHTDKPEFK